MALPTSATRPAGLLIFRRLSALIPPTLGSLAAPAASRQVRRSKHGHLRPPRNLHRKRQHPHLTPLRGRMRPPRLFRSRIPLRARRSSIRLTAPLPPPALADPQLNTLV